MVTTNQVVAVKFLGYLGRLTGHREATVTVDLNATVDDLLATLAARYGAEFASAIYRSPGEVHTHLLVFLNEQEARLTDRVDLMGGPEMAPDYRTKGADAPLGLPRPQRSHAPRETRGAARPSLTKPEVAVLIVPGFEGGSHA
ncbi:MAG: MoaD/ThiS family protein [Candidatus Rokubacteria bacterium]|nr:MoaD/ThiS family protein [Candidatus Rokubacteria bacterium]